MTIHPPSTFPHGQIPVQVAFDRRELGVIMSVYGRMVAAGEWRGHGCCAVFRGEGGQPDVNRATLEMNYKF